MEKKLWLTGMFWLLLAAASPTQAQNFAIDWYKISSGGASSTGGVYTVTGTIGQPDAGTVSGGKYTLDGGFWGVALAVQTPGAPLLTVIHSGNNVLISWPNPSSGFVLEVTSNLNPPATWLSVSGTPVTVNQESTITLPASQGFQFYRLRKH